jgi:hypothetical protein
MSKRPDCTSKVVDCTPKVPDCTQKRPEVLVRYVRPMNNPIILAINYTGVSEILVGHHGYETRQQL